VKKPSSEVSLFGPSTRNEDSVTGTEKTKRLSSAATAGVATSTPETYADGLGLPDDSGNSLTIKKLVSAFPLL
jgi:hypothetical protein